MNNTDEQFGGMFQQDACLIFEQSRHDRPQEVIDALIKQTGRQGKAIHDLLAKVARLESLIASLSQRNAELEEALAQRVENLPEIEGVPHAVTLLRLDNERLRGCLAMACHGLHGQQQES